MATKIGSLFGEVRLDTRKMEKSLKRANRKLRRFGRQASVAGRNVAMGFGAPLAGAVAVSIRTFAEFEQEMAKVQAVSGATNKQFARLTQLAEDLGTKTRFTASEVAGLQLNFSKLGLTADEIEKVTEATLQLALASGSDLAESATIAASTMRGFQLDATEMQRITDVMAKSFSSSALDLEKFGVAMATAQTAANVSGKTLEETTAILAVLINRGIEASTAGTHLRRIFIDLNDKSMTLEEGIAKVAEAQDKLGVATDLVGARAATSLVALTQSREEMTRLTSEFENAEGAAKEMAETMDATVMGAMLRLRSAVEGTIISFMKAGGRDSDLQKFIDKIATNIVLNKEAIMTYAGLAVKVAIIGVVAGVATMALGQLSFALVSINSAILMVSKNFFKFIKPLAIIIAVAYVLKTAIEDLKGGQVDWADVTIKTVAFIMTAFELAAGTIKVALEKIGTAIAFVVKTLDNLVGALNHPAIRTASFFNPALRPLVQLSDGLDSVKEKLSAQNEAATEGVGAQTELGRMYEDNVAKLEGFADGLKTVISGFNSLDGKAIESGDILGSEMERISEEIAESSKIMEEELKTMGEKMMESINATFTHIGKQFDKFVNDDVHSFKAQTGRLIEDLSKNMTDGFVKFFNEGKAGLDDFVGDFIRQVQRMVIETQVTQPLMQGIGQLFTKGKNSNWFGKTVDFFAGMFKADGGTVNSGSPYIVGERGAELFVPNRSGTIVPNEALGGGTPVVVNFNISAVDSNGFDALLASRQSTIVGIIDQALNRRGRGGISG